MEKFPVFLSLLISLIFTAKDLHAVGRSGSHPIPFMPEMQTRILEYHNKIRSSVAVGEITDIPTASNMRKLSWSESLSSEALKVVQDYCRFNTRMGYSRLGANVAAIQKRFGNLFRNPTKKLWEMLENFIKEWFDERESFQFPNCGSENCNNFLELITAETKFLGCALTYCMGEGKFVFACKYNPPRQTEDSDPYKIGDPCSDCPLIDVPQCMDNLCVEPPEDRSESSKSSELLCPGGLDPEYSAEDPDEPQRCLLGHSLASGDCSRGFTCQQSPSDPDENLCCPKSEDLLERKENFCPNDDIPEFFPDSTFAKLCRLGEAVISSCSPGFLCTKNELEHQRFYCCPVGGPPEEAEVENSPGEVQFCPENLDGTVDWPEFSMETGQPIPCNPAIWFQCSQGFSCVGAPHEYLEGKFFCCPIGRRQR